MQRLKSSIALFLAGAAMSLASAAAAAQDGYGLYGRFQRAPAAQPSASGGYDSTPLPAYQAGDYGYWYSYSCRRSRAEWRLPWEHWGGWSGGWD